VFESGFVRVRHKAKGLARFLFPGGVREWRDGGRLGMELPDDGVG
jgi:hypothetical protein